MVEYEYKEIKKRFFYDGVLLASFVGRYPSFAEYEYISKFYEELTKSCFEWFCGEFCDTLVASYDADTDEKKRFHRVACHYEANFCVSEENDILSVSCNITLKKGNRKTLARFNEEQKWDASGQMMIRPKKRKKEKKNNSE